MIDEPMTPDHDFSDDAAAYALGALEPTEAEAFRSHLATCAICRDEIAALRTAVEALPLSAHQYEAPPQLRERVLASVHADVEAVKAGQPGQPPVRRRHRIGAWLAGVPRPALALAATVVALAIGLGAGLAINSGSSTSTRTIAASVGNAHLRVTGNRGELLVGHLPALPPGDIYEVWLMHRGAKAPTPTRTLFGVTKAGTADVGLASSLADVTDVLVTPEPAGGSLAPTHTPVIDAKVA